MPHSSVRPGDRPQDRRATQARTVAAEWIRRQLRWEETLADLREGKSPLRKAA